jgi:hypothetical protein
MNALHAVLAEARDLSLADQRELQKLLAENITALERIESVRATGFEVGDTVQFSLRPTNEVQITITSFSRDGMGIQGTTPDGTTFIISADRCRKM